MKQHKGKIFAAVVILCVLAAAFFWGGNYAGRDVSYKMDTPVNTATPAVSAVPETPVPVQEASPLPLPEKLVETPAPTGMPDGAKVSGTPDVPPQPDKEAKPSNNPTPSATPQAQQREDSSEGVFNGSASYSEAQGMAIDAKTGKDKYLTEPVPEGKPIPVEPHAAAIKDTAYSCTLSVRCDTILKNMKYLNKEKVELVPEDGGIFPATKVTFYQGESVFNVLQREMKKNKIHMEFRNTPIYNSAYIEGIHNLYEFDCGELSGWMYKVNGWFPNYGCSRYQLKADDVVEWVYTCDLGRDVGGYYATGEK